jgi:N-acetyllactosaminide beta-1,3-N-acetylglucosaminyltransferase
MDYEFHILNNAFLIHKPGIKLPRGRGSKGAPKRQKIQDQNRMIANSIIPDMSRLFGKRNGCRR